MNSRKFASRKTLKMTAIGWLVLCLGAASAHAQTPALTTVKDTVYKSDGTLASGTVVITWQGFVSADNRPVFGGNKTVPLTNGALAVALVPNVGGTPSGTSYKVRYYQSGGLFFEETWLVPASAPLASPAGPTVIPQGSTGSTSYCYWISAANAAGETLLGPSTCIANGNAVLDGTNYNQISWTAVSGATGYKIYRTANPNTPSGTGNYLAGTTAGTTFDDQSSSLAVAEVPSVNTTDPRTLADVRVAAAPSESVVLAPAQVTGTAIVSNPTSTQTITAPSGSGIPLQITGRSNNSSNIFEIYDNQAQPQLRSYFNTGGALVSGPAPTFSAMSAGSLLFAGTGGLLSQDNSQLFWDNSAKGLKVGPRTGFGFPGYLASFQNHFTLLNPPTTGMAALGAMAQDDTTKSFWGGYGVVDSRHTSGNRAVAVALEGDAFHNGAGGTVGTLEGVFGYAENGAGTGGDVTQAAGLASLAWHSGNSTTTDLMGIWVRSNGKSAGTVANNYGLKVEDQSAGTNNWAIKTGVGKVEFGDEVVSKRLNRVLVADQWCTIPGTLDQSCINNAVTALGTTGGTIFVPNGTYNISSPVSIPGAGIELQGSRAGGVYGSKLKATSADIDILQITSATATIRGILFEGFQQGGGVGNGILLDTQTDDGSVHDVQITDCWFTMIPKAAINIRDASGIQITNNFLENAEYGVYASPDTSPELRASNNIQIVGNRFFGLDKNAIYASGGDTGNTTAVRYWTVSGNIFDFNGSSADPTSAAVRFLDHANDMSIAANQFNNNQADDIMLQNVRNISVSGNSSSRTGRSVVYALDSLGVAITGNTAATTNYQSFGGTTASFYIAQGTGSSSDNLVSGNTTKAWPERTMQAMIYLLTHRRPGRSSVPILSEATPPLRFP